MDGVRYQIEQLQYALGQLDTHRMLIQEDAAQLQLALANATAVARRVVERQAHRNLNRHSATNKNSRTSDNSRNGYRNSASSLQAKEMHEEHNEVAHMAGHSGNGGGISRSSSNAIDLNKKKDEVDKRTVRSKESLIQQSCSETLYSVAKLHNISLDEIRNYNPQLSEFDDDEVLPPNTFIKMKLHMNETSQFAEISDLATNHHRVVEPLLGPDDTMTAEVPLPLAPLPDMQDAPRRSTYIEEVTINYTPIKNDREQGNNVQDNGSRRVQLLMLPSPSPNRRCLSVDNSINQSNIKDDRYRVDSSLEVSVNTPGDKHPSKTMGVGTTTVPTSLFSSPHIEKPPTTPHINMNNDAENNNDNNGDNNINNNTNNTTTTTNNNNDPTTTPSASPIIKLRPGDRDQSLITESSSFHSTPTPTPYVSPKPRQKQMDAKNDMEDIHNKEKDETTTLKKVINEEVNPSVPDNNIDDNLGINNELSPIIGDKSPYPEGNGEDFDTLNSIAQQYEVTVKDVLKWNPYLVVYEADEPLPPNLPIVLPLQQDQQKQPQPQPQQ